MPIHPKQYIVYRYSIALDARWPPNLDRRIEVAFEAKFIYQNSKNGESFYLDWLLVEPETKTSVKRKTKLKCIACFEIFKGD